jgi:PAS domain S-box-containing protein
MVIALLAMVVLSVVYLSLTLRSLERTLPTTLLGQLEHLNRITAGLGETVSASALAVHDPTPQSLKGLAGKVDGVFSQVVSMRETFVFDNLVQASAFHSAVAPSLVDVRQWLAHGVSGLAPDSPQTMRIVHARLLDSFRKAVTLRDESHAAARQVLESQRLRLDRFIFGVNAFLVLTLLLSALSLALMLRHRRLVRQEESSRAEREFLATILESTSDFVCTSDPEGRLTFLNQSGRRLLGIGPGESLEGRRVAELFPERALSRIAAEGMPATLSGGVWEGENAVLDRDGREVSVSQVIIPHDAPGAFRGYSSSVMRDITERKRAEARMAEALEALREAKAGAEAANRAKSEFLANMSHEIRTPVNGIMGMLQLLSGTSLDAEQAACTRTAIRSCNRLVRLLSDILDLSRIEAGKLSVQNAPMDLRDVFCQVRALFEPVALENGVELRFEVDEAIPPRVLGDASRLQQVLINLVGNALKFTTAGHVAVEAVALPGRRQRRCRVFFSVTDTGAGIPDDKLGQLFRPFSQLDAGYTRNHQGAGLGLSICRRLVELMGGGMSVSSESGVGTTMAFALDFGIDAGIERLALRTGDGALESLAGRRVLVAEDDAVSAMAVSAMLRKLGALVTHVADGRLAVEAIGREPFDLVLMDVQMPVMNGVEATRAIREGRAGEGHRGVPVVAMTAYAMAGDREAFMEAGMNGYLAKPVEMAKMQRVIGELLRP